MLLTFFLPQPPTVPLCILVEDTHWIDPTTQELINLLIDRLADLRVLLLITHRPEFGLPWGTPAYLTRLAMNRLNARACAGLIGDLARGKPLPDEVLRQIVAKADGVPLFVEELTKAVLESGLLPRMPMPGGSTARCRRSQSLPVCMTPLWLVSTAWRR